MFKKLIAITALFVGTFHSHATVGQLNTNALTQSISDVETGGEYWRIGSAGERSQYQIKASVWRRYSSVPFWMASKKAYQVEAKRVAICYINEISEGVVGSHVRTIALKWNGGPNKTYYTKHNISYANRVSNLYNCYAYLPDVVQPKKIIPIKITIDIGITAPAIIHEAEPTVQISQATNFSFCSPILAEL